MIGLGISAIIGAIVGATAYTISESVSYAITGEWSWSWAQFTRNTLGGALGGALSFITPKASIVLIGGLTGFSSTGFSMLLQNKWEGNEYTTWQIINSSIISGLFAAASTGISDYFKISGLNSGKNSYMAISKQIVTKFRNNTISKISFNTFSKMLTYNLFVNLMCSFVSGGMDTFDLNNIIVRLKEG